MNQSKPVSTIDFDNESSVNGTLHHLNITDDEKPVWGMPVFEDNWDSNLTDNEYLAMVS